MNDLHIFISGGIFGAARPCIILNALSPTRLNSAAHFFHCAIRRRIIPKCFHEVFVNFLGSHSLLTKIFYHRSHFNFLHFASLTHCPLSILSYKSNQAWPNVFYSPDDFQLNRMTDLTRILSYGMLYQA